MFDSLKTSLVDVLRPILPLPLWQKALALGIVFLLIVGAYVFMGWTSIQEEIVREEQNLEMQRVMLAKNKRLAQDLPRKQKEYADLEKQLKVALNMLPKKSQIPDLLESVSWAGKDSGLEFNIFKPEREVAKQIYAEVPVDLDVHGSFRQLLTFLKRVGEMPRIVDVKNLTLTQEDNNVLTVKGEAVTYRFVEEAPKSTRTDRAN